MKGSLEKDRLLCANYWHWVPIHNKYIVEGFDTFAQTTSKDGAQNWGAIVLGNAILYTTFVKCQLQCKCSVVWFLCALLTGELAILPANVVVAIIAATHEIKISCGDFDHQWHLRIMFWFEMIWFEWASSIQETPPLNKHWLRLNSTRNTGNVATFTPVAA